MNPDFDLWDGAHNSVDSYWNAAGGYENMCLIGANASGVIMNNKQFYGITSVDFYADGSNITGPGRAVTSVAGVGNPTKYTVIGGVVAGSSTVKLSISPGILFNPGEAIRISGAIGTASAYNGDWFVSPPDPNGVYAQQRGFITLSTVNGTKTIPAGTPVPTGATIVSTEPMYWCAHVYPKDYNSGMHQFRAVVHYLNGWTTILENAKHIASLDTIDNNGILVLNGGFGFSSYQSVLGFLPQTNFGQANTYDCIIPGQGYLVQAVPSYGNPFWGGIQAVDHMRDDQLILAQNTGFTINSGSTSANGSIAQFTAPASPTVASNASPLTEGSTISTNFTIPSQTSTSITPHGTTADIALSSAITVHGGDQVKVSGLTNPTYAISNISIANGVATAFLAGTGATDILAPAAQAPLSIINITWPANSTLETINLSTNAIVSVGTTVQIAGATLATGSGNPNILTGVVTTSSAGQFVIGNPAITGATAGTATGGTATQTSINGEAVTINLTGFGTGIITSTGVAVTNFTGVNVIAAASGHVSFATTNTGSATGGSLALTAGGWNQTLNTTTNASGSVTVQFPDGESFSNPPTGTATVQWQTGQAYRVASYSYQRINNLGDANETVTVAPAGGHAITFVPGQIIYLTGMPNITYNLPNFQITQQQPLTGYGVSGWVQVIAAPSANTFTFYNPSMYLYQGYSVFAGGGGVTWSTTGGVTTEVLKFSVPGIAGTQPTLAVGTNVTLRNVAFLSNNAANFQNLTVTASSPGQISVVNPNLSGSGTSVNGTLLVNSGTLANSKSPDFIVGTPFPTQIATSNLNIVIQVGTGAGTGFTQVPAPGVTISSLVQTNIGLSTATDTIQYPTNLVTPTGLVITTATGKGTQISWKKAPTHAGVCTDSNIIVAPYYGAGVNSMPYGTANNGASDAIQQWQSLWENTNFDGMMYTPTFTVNNHQNASDASPNQFNVTNAVDNGNGTATATFKGNYLVPKGSYVTVSDIIAADPNVEGYNTFSTPSQSVSSSIAGSNVTFSPVSGLAGCNSSPTVTITYPATSAIFTSAIIKVQGIVNSGSGSSYANTWNGIYGICNAGGVSGAETISYNVSFPATGTPIWTGSLAVIASGKGLSPAQVTASTQASPNSTVTYQVQNATAALTTYKRGGTIDVVDCGLSGQPTCSTIDGALFSSKSTGGIGSTNFGSGISFSLSIGANNWENFSTTYTVANSPLWSVAGGMCSFTISLPAGSSALPAGSEIDATLNTSTGSVTITDGYLATSIITGGTADAVTVPCSVSGTPTAGGSVAWYSEFHVGQILYGPVNSNFTPNNMTNGIYPLQPYFIEASTGPGTDGGTPISQGSSFLLSSVPNGTPLTEASTTFSTAEAMQSTPDFTTICLAGPNLSGLTPSASQKYKLGDQPLSGVAYYNLIGWTAVQPCNLPARHAVVINDQGQFGMATRFLKFESLDICGNTSINTLPYCSQNDGAVYRDLGITYGTTQGAVAAWADNENLYGYSGFFFNGPITSGSTNIAAYITNQFTYNFTWPSGTNPSNSETAVENMAYVNNPGQFANLSLVDHVVFDGVPESGFKNATKCDNSGAPGWPNIEGCYNPAGTLGTGIWTGGKGSGININPLCGTSGQPTCDPANTAGCNQSGTAYACNIVPIAQIQRDVQALLNSTPSTTIPASWMHINGGPFYDNSNLANALNLNSSSNLPSIAWQPTGNGFPEIGLITTGVNAGKTFAMPNGAGGIPAGGTAICVGNQHCLVACFDASLVNPACPEGQASFIAAGCDIRIAGVYDPAHSSTCVQLNTVVTSSSSNINNQVPLTCSIYGAAGPALCNSSNGADQWVEAWQWGVGNVTNGQTYVGLWNGTHLDIVFNKINPLGWGMEVVNALDVPLSDPSCRLSGFQIYPIQCNLSQTLIFTELSFTGPIALLNSNGWVGNSGAGGFGNDNKYVKNSQFEEGEAGVAGGAYQFANSAASGLPADYFNPQNAATGKIMDNDTCWAGPSGELNNNIQIDMAGFNGAGKTSSGFLYDGLPVSNVSVSGTTATLTYAGIPWTPPIGPGSLIIVSGLTGGLANANSANSSVAINAGGNFYTLVTAGSSPGTLQFQVPTGMTGLSQSLGITLTWPFATYWNDAGFGTTYNITSVTWNSTTGVETVNYTSTDSFPIFNGARVSIQGITTNPSLNIAATNVTTASIGTVGGNFGVVNPNLPAGTGTDTSGGTVTFSQACQF